MRAPTLVIVKAVEGKVEYSVVPGRWNDATTNLALGKGAFLRSQTNSTADLFLPFSGSVLRLTPNTLVQVDRLERTFTGLENITETRLLLKEGSVVGSQSKLPRASTFTIVTDSGVATLTGTDYVVRKDGAVSVLSGSVSVRYNNPTAGGSVSVVVQTGQSFNPATGTVVPTTPEFLQGAIAHINTVQQNAETFKAQGATVVVKPEEFVSPVLPGNNGVGNGIDGQPPGNPPVNDGPGTSPGSPGNQGGANQ